MKNETELDGVHSVEYRVTPIPQLLSTCFSDVFEIFWHILWCFLVIELWQNCHWLLRINCSNAYNATDAVNAAAAADDGVCRFQL